MIELIPVRGLPEIREGDDLAALVVELIELRDRDVVVLAQKVVSKQEGRIIRIDSLEASEKAIELAGDDAARMQKLLDVLEDLDDVQNVFHNAEL